jgi:hypothetical protein
MILIKMQLKNLYMIDKTHIRIQVVTYQAVSGVVLQFANWGATRDTLSMFSSPAMFSVMGEITRDAMKELSNEKQLLFT